ncbi:hypothetical protein AMTRI_Chr09g14470 [Amborella trichopoda]
MPSGLSVYHKQLHPLVRSKNVVHNAHDDPDKNRFLYCISIDIIFEEIWVHSCFKRIGLGMHQMYIENVLGPREIRPRMCFWLQDQIHNLVPHNHHGFLQI